MMITLPTNSLGTLKHFLQNNRDLTFRFMLREINKGLDEHALQVNLFQFGETHLITAVRQPQYGLVLQQALDYFKGRELYEDAALCRDVLRKFHQETDAQLIEAYLDGMNTPTTK